LPAFRQFAPNMMPAPTRQGGLMAASVWRGSIGGVFALSEAGALAGKEPKRWVFDLPTLRCVG